MALRSGRGRLLVLEPYLLRDGRAVRLPEPIARPLLLPFERIHLLPTGPAAVVRAVGACTFVRRNINSVDRIHLLPTGPAVAVRA